MNLNRKNLRHLILEEMAKLISEQNEDNAWQTIDLKGVVAQGRPALQGEYTVVSDGTYADLGDQVKFRVTSYEGDTQHDAVGSEFTLAQVQAREKSRGGADTYQGHPIWDKLVAAAKQEAEDWQSENPDLASAAASQTSLGGAEEEVEADDLAMLAEPGEIERLDLDDMEARLSVLRDKIASRDEVAGLDLGEMEALEQELHDFHVASEAGILAPDDKAYGPTLRERDVPVSVITLDGEDNARTRRFKKRLERQLADMTLTMPLGVHTVLTTDWSEDGRISTKIARNEVNPNSLPSDYTDPDSNLYLSGQFEEDEGTRVEEMDDENLVNWINDRVHNPRVSDTELGEFRGPLQDIISGLRADSRNARAMRDLRGVTFAFYADEEGAADETRAQAWRDAGEVEDTDLALTR